MGNTSATSTLAVDKLAIKGGTPVLKSDEIQPWPPVDETDHNLVMKTIKSGKYTYGEQCQAFQNEFKDWNGNTHAIVTNSGTAALHMAIVACGCGVGDEVIVTAYSWSSSATCILHHNAIPVFVDIDYDTMNIDVEKIEAAITPRTKAIIAVHLHGLPVDMDKVMDIAKRHNLKVIEDACQAHGGLYKGKKVGTIGDCGAFSLNQNKCLCAGEGGIFVTNDQTLHDRAATLWSFGETKKPGDDRDYHAYAMGWMYRTNELTAAFARTQLAKLDYYIATQRENAACLTNRLKEIPGLILPMAPEGCENNFYNYTIRFDERWLRVGKTFKEGRDKIVKALAAEGVQTNVWQAFSLPSMTVFQAKSGYQKGCPWSCHLAEPVDYSMHQYPEAERHCATHTGMTVPIRAPNTAAIAEKVGDAYAKVYAQLDVLADL